MSNFKAFFGGGGGVKVEHAKTITPPKTKTLQFCTISILILRMFKTSTSASRYGFGSSTNKILNPYNFFIRTQRRHILEVRYVCGCAFAWLRV